MVSAKKDDIDKIRGLGLGADDYMTKPFSPSINSYNSSTIVHPTFSYMVIPYKAAKTTKLYTNNQPFTYDATSKS